MPFELWNTWKDSNINRWYARENNGKGNGASPTTEKIRYFGLKRDEYQFYTHGVSIKFHRTSERRSEGKSVG